MAKRKNMVLPVRDLLKFTPHELLKGLRTNLHIEFESGEEPIRYMTWKEITLQRYLLDLLCIDLSDGRTTINLSDIPISSDFCICNYYSEGIFTANTITKYLECVYRTVVETYRDRGFSRAMLPKFYYTIVVIYNTIYNDVVYNIVDYVGSSRVTDFIQIQENEELLQSMLAVRQADLKDKNDAIQNSYAVLDKILRDNTLYPKNDIRLGYVSGNINARQVRQLLSCRGFITELDGTIFKYPVYNSFTLGMHDIYDLTIESRAGAKSLYISNEAVQKSEYFARGLQLVTMILEKLVDGDCGTKNYMDWYVKPATKTTKSDIENLLGKRFLNPHTGKEEVITSNHKWLEGTTIKLRTILRCALRDKRTVCMACFGEIGYSVPTHANLGHFCSVELSEKITQAILSTKHEMSSAKTNEIRLAESTKEFMTVQGSDFYFKDIINNPKSKYSIVVSQQEAFGIKDINLDTKISSIDPLRVSRIEGITLVKQTGNNVESFYLPIKDANRPGSFTGKFIEHILKNRWTLSDRDEYVIPLDKWNTKYPIINLLELEYSFKVLNSEVSKAFKNVKQKRGVGSELSPEVFLLQLFDKVNSKLSVNVSLLEGIVYPFVIRDYANLDFRIGGFDANGEMPNRSLYKLHYLITNRSLGAAYGWERVLNDVLKSTTAFNGVNAIDHPMDVTIKPNDVIKRLDKLRK